MLREGRQRVRVALDGVTVFEGPYPFGVAGCQIHCTGPPIGAARACSVHLRQRIPARLWSERWQVGKTRTSNIRSHLPVGYPRSLQQRYLCILIEDWLKFPFAQTRRQGDVGSAGVGVNDEDVGIFHLALTALTQANPLQRRRALDLEINVLLGTGCGCFRNVDLVAGTVCALWTVAGEVLAVHTGC